MRKNLKQMASESLAQLPEDNADNALSYQTCIHSAWREGRMLCRQLGRRLVPGYCETCLDYRIGDNK